MTAAHASQELTAFIRNVLGCGCPPEVFERVDESPSEASQRAGVTRRIDVGGRLLIYLVEPDDLERIVAQMPDWISAGRAERDAAGMNRLRLVIAVLPADPAELVPIESAFAAVAGTDDRLHLHIVRPDQIPPH